MYVNRTGWALSQLARVRALSRPSRGNYQLAEADREVLEEFPADITEKQLDVLGEDPSSAFPRTYPRYSLGRLSQ